LPPRVQRPEMKSVPDAGAGRGAQYRRFGSTELSPNGGAIRVPLSMRWNGGCSVDGRIRYSHVRRVFCRSSVKAVPDRSSVYKPWGGRWGVFRPTGNAPGNASLLCSLPNPVEYFSEVALARAAFRTSYSVSDTCVRLHPWLHGPAGYPLFEPLRGHSPPIGLPPPAVPQSIPLRRQSFPRDDGRIRRRCRFDRPNRAWIGRVFGVRAAPRDQRSGTATMPRLTPVGASAVALVQSPSPTPVSAAPP
jgi:hypothetical protein